MKQPDVSTTDNSLLTNLTNKVTYKLQQVAYDPKANEYAKKQEELKQADSQKKEAVKATTDTTNETDKFSGTRLVKKVGSQTLNILGKIVIPFIALMLAMIVANEMIIYSVPIRVIFFIFTLVAGILLPFYTIILGIFYIFKGGYSYWVNNISDGPKRTIMPTIFALLPITTKKPVSKFSKIVMYPFTYPKTDLAALTLVEIMKEYWNDLVKSFKDYEQLKNLQPFADNIKKLQTTLTHMHDVKETVEVTTNNSVNTP